MITKPMLAGKAPADLSQLQFPLLATPKLDGIRCLIIGGKAVSRTFKPIPNKFIRDLLEAICYDGMDGEILVKDRDFNQLSGDVRREDGKPDFYYAVFDYVNYKLASPYTDRMKHLRDLEETGLLGKVGSSHLEFLYPTEIKDLPALLAYETECLAQGYEGVMVRTPNSPYKEGRSSTKEGYLLKIKRFEDDEATVVGYEEEMENKNEAKKDNFGRTKRASNQENLVGKGRLGRLVCQSPKWPETFGIGTGFDADTRHKLWQRRTELTDKLVKFKHQASGAGVDRPRIPVFLGFRDAWDL